MQAYFDEGDYIVRQGATGDTMYIISKGKVISFHFNYFILIVYL